MDLVLYGEPGIWAFEVKNAARVRPEDLRGLVAFGDEYPEARRVLLYRGSERLVRRTVLCARRRGLPRPPSPAQAA